MPEFNLQIHPSIRPDTVPKVITSNIKGLSIIKAIISLLEEYVEIKNEIIENDKIKPGLLVFADKTELTTMGLMDSEIDEDLNIRIVPILHGG